MTDAMRPHSIKFTDTDWNTLTALAAGRNVTVGQVISELLQIALAEQGVKWNGGKRREPNKPAKH